MRIIQVFRAPVGGLFRHVRDLVTELNNRGHEIAIICDDQHTDSLTNKRLKDLGAICSLGVHQITMPRIPGFSDLKASYAVRKKCHELQAEIVHGHGAKGGLYARMACTFSPVKACYTPHGGVLNFATTSLSGIIYLCTERLSAFSTSGFSFVCRYERDGFHNKIGGKNIPYCVAHNGLLEEEFYAVKTNKDASDFLFLGELRHIKGIDVLLKAVAELHRSGQKATLTIVGDGPDRAQMEALRATLGLDDYVSFTGAMPAHEAFQKGRIMVMPSRNESFPYVALEGQAAQLPFIATDVGGVNEMIDPENLIPPDDVPALAKSMETMLSDMKSSKLQAKKQAEVIRENFNVGKMATTIEEFYKILK